MYLHLIDIFSCIDRRFIIERGNKYDILFSFSMVEGRGQNTANKSREGNYGCHVTVYKFALGLFGLQIDFIGSLQRIDCCGPSIGCMQPLVSLVLSSMEFHISLQGYSKLNSMKVLCCKYNFFLLK